MLELHHYNNLKTSKTALSLRFSLKRLNQADVGSLLLRILVPLRQSEAISEDVSGAMPNFIKRVYLSRIV